MSRIMLYALILVLILSPTICVFTEAQSINGVYYRVIYDPLENTGILEVKITIGTENITWIYIPVRIFGEETSLEYMEYNYTSGLKPLGVNYDPTQGLVEIQAQGTGELYLLFHISNLLEETGIGAYTLYIDTTDLSYLTNNVTVDLTLTGVFEQDTARIRGELEITTMKSANTTQILIKGLGEIISSLYMQLEETTGIPFKQQSSMNIFLSILIVTMAAIILFSYYYFARRRTKIIVERIDYMKDQASILILKALRESRDKGLTQAEISKITKLPKSSVSRRIRKLEEEGFVEVKRVGKYNYVFLTNKGLELAKKIFGGEK
ncbi:MAG: winged helix-turn-helix transcriptional regulator [Desulfurococcaceae archaeon]